MAKNKKAIDRHAKQQAFVRFNVLISNRKLRDLVRDIESGKAPLIEYLSNTRGLYLVSLADGVKAKAVYSHKQRKIITILGKSCLGHPNISSVRKTVNAILKDL